MKRLTLFLVLLNTCLIILAGCSTSPQTKFYVLSNLPQAAVRPLSEGRDIAVGVGPVELPDYLDRPQIVTRSGQNELNMAEFDRWGESLKDNAAQVLAENLAVLLASKKIHTFPWARATQLDYQVNVKITRFDHTDGGDTVLHSRWTVLSGNGNAEISARETRYVEHPDGKGYAATVAAMNRALAQFSRDVAHSISELAIGHIGP